jgi:phosphoadenosine phosphosulfate reductase
MQKASEISMKLFGQPLVVTYSGGKDSDVVLQIAKNAKIPFEVLHNLTTADAPETVYHIRNVFKELELEGIKCTVDKPVYKGKRTSMWNLIPQKSMPPTRIVRYCCAVLKEKGGTGRFIATGVRWDESAARKNNRGTMEVIHRDREKRLILQDDNDEARRTFETCKVKGKRVVNPIVEWKKDDVLQYIKDQKIEINPLYGCGFDRVGCVGCPLAGTEDRQFEFAVFPVFKQNYIRAFDRMLEARKKNGKSTENWENGIDVFHWWMEDGVSPGQIVLEGFEE